MGRPEKFHSLEQAGSADHTEAQGIAEVGNWSVLGKVVEDSGLVLIKDQDSEVRGTSWSLFCPF